MRCMHAHMFFNIALKTLFTLGVFYAENNWQIQPCDRCGFGLLVVFISREHGSSPKHLPHSHSPSSSSSGHSSPRSPPSHPPPPLPSTTTSSGAGLRQQRPPHSHPPSHATRSKSHDFLYGYHGDPNKAGSNWKYSPSMQRGHTRASSDPKKQEMLAALLMSTNERGFPSGPGSPQIPPQRYHPESMTSEHASPRSHYSSRFSPEGIQAETGERGGGRGEPKPPPRGGDPSSLMSSSYAGGRGGGGGKMGGGKSSLASVSYDSQTRPGGVASGGGEEFEGGRAVIPANHVALRVAQFSGSAAEEREDGGRGKVPSPGSGNIRSPEMEKAKILTISPGSSEEELTSIHSESGLGEGSEVTDGAYHHGHKEEGVQHTGGSGFDPGHPHPQLSQPTYLNRAPPSSTSQGPFPHNPASFPSLSQPHASFPYETNVHHRGGMDVPLNRSYPSPQLHQKHHPHQPHRLPPQSHDYHQRSHDPHMTGYPGSHEPHMTGHPYEQHHISPHHEHHVTSQHRGNYRQQGHTHSQQSHAHPQQGHAHSQRLSISKQNLIKAHEAAANGNLIPLVSKTCSKWLKLFSMFFSLRFLL